MIRSFRSIRLVRSVAFLFAAGWVSLAAAAGPTNEIFPNAHSEPIIIRILDGKHGQPLVHVHLILVAGYDKRDIRLRLWEDEALTDDQGRARLPNQLANLPFLRIKVAKKHMCLANAGATLFSVEQMRGAGLSAPNRCGFATVTDAPGVFTVFVKASGIAKARYGSQRSVQSATAAGTPATSATPAAAVPAAAPVQAPATEPTQNGLVRLRSLAASYVRLQGFGLLR